MSLCTEDEGLMDHGSVQYLLSLNLPVDHQDTAEGQESLKAKLNAVRNKLVRQVSENEPWLPSEAQLGDISSSYWDGYDAFVDASHRWILPQGPCHTELHAALDTITSSQQTLGEKFTTFYLPNCDKHGYYKAKQVPAPHTEYYGQNIVL